MILTYYWPPSGGGGVQRWLKFTKYLRDFEWEPIIYTPKNPDFEIADKTLEKDIPEGLTVLKHPIWEPYSFYRRLLGKKAVQQQGVVANESKSLLSRLAVWVRGNYFIPDSRVFWVRPSVNYLSRYLKKNKIDVIITTGPPHSIHLIGLELKKRLDIKWVADFRDPWSKWDVLDQLNLTAKSRKSHGDLERAVLKNANLVITVSPSLENSLKELGATNTKLITNGFDSEVIPPELTVPNKFRISHVGLLNMGRNPAILWEVLNELSEEDDQFSNDLDIYLAGTIENEVIYSIEKFDRLKDKLSNAGYRSHNEVMNDYADSALLLLLINDTDNAQWILPGKMYEYLAQGKPVLAFGKEDSDASRILITGGQPACLNYTDKQKIKEIVLEEYEQFKNRETALERKEINKFSRKELTKTLAACLDELQ